MITETSGKCHVASVMFLFYPPFSSVCHFILESNPPLVSDPLPAPVCLLSAPPWWLSPVSSYPHLSRVFSLRVPRLFCQFFFPLRCKRSRILSGVWFPSAFWACFPACLASALAPFCGCLLHWLISCEKSSLQKRLPFWKLGLRLVCQILGKKV